MSWIAKQDDKKTDENNRYFNIVLSYYLDIGKLNNHNEINGTLITYNAETTAGMSTTATDAG